MTEEVLHNDIRQSAEGRFWDNVNKLGRKTGYDGKEQEPSEFGYKTEVNWHKVWEFIEKESRVSVMPDKTVFIDRFAKKPFTGKVTLEFNEDGTIKQIIDDSGLIGNLSDIEINN